MSMMAMNTFFKFSLSLLSKRIENVLWKIISQNVSASVEDAARMERLR
jgi:hypothetical protein